MLNMIDFNGISTHLGLFYNYTYIYLNIFRKQFILIQFMFINVRPNNLLQGFLHQFNGHKAIQHPKYNGFCCFLKEKKNLKRKKTKKKKQHLFQSNFQIFIEKQMHMRRQYQLRSLKTLNENVL